MKIAGSLARASFEDSPFRKIEEMAIEMATHRVLTTFEGIVSDCESPIEEIFATALLTLSNEGGMELPVTIFPRGIAFDQFSLIELCRDKYRTVVEPQVQVCGARVDFLVSVGIFRGGRDFLGVARLVVECDGHEFHERTKQQAKRDRARDRKFQMEGLSVFRFTGSEIWNDPVGCAEQVIKWVDDKSYVK